MEQWKRYKDLNYEVSESGQVRNINTGRIQKFNKNLNGYHRVNLRKDKKHYYRFVHHLVYELYKGELKEGLVIDHIDGNKQNNHHSNLQLITRSANTKKQKPRKMVRYTQEQKLIILEDLKNNSAHSIYKKYGISHSYLSRVKYKEEVWAKEKELINFYE